MPSYKEKTKDTWYCKFYYVDYDGRRQQKFKRGFVTREDALNYEKEFLAMRLTDGGQELFSRVYEEYISSLENTLKLSTIELKKRIFSSKILPVFGSMKIEDITPAMIVRWQSKLTGSDRMISRSYAANIYSQFVTFMNYVDKTYGLPVNPCRRVSGIRDSKPEEKTIWTLEEYTAFRDGLSVQTELSEICAYTCFEILYWTGIREGELLALTKDDIDFDRLELSINKTYSRINGRDYIRPPKTRSSRRKVGLPEFLADEIRNYLELADTKNIRIFPVQRFFLSYRMKKYSGIAGVPYVTLHTLRHSHVSLLIRLGFDPVEIAKRLGHERVSVTLNTYSHMFPSRQKVITDKLNELGQHP
ncbi:MAG: site-specific integrase [Eubacterium sp.]|nr:site-specific integrase [Eubacterium sp.]